MKKRMLCLFLSAILLLGLIPVTSLRASADDEMAISQDAIDVLMTDVTETLRAINSEVLIEFRQPYVGPAIRKYGNMLRVADCPNDAICNRQDIVNLILLCTVHGIQLTALTCTSATRTAAAIVRVLGWETAVVGDVEHRLDESLSRRLLAIVNVEAIDASKV